MEFTAQLSAESFRIAFIRSASTSVLPQESADRGNIPMFLSAIGYPIAYGMAARPTDGNRLLVMAVVLPFWTSLPHPHLRLDQHPTARRACSTTY